MKMKIDSYYEIRVNGWKVAAFAPIRRKASEQAFQLVETVKDDLYKGTHIQIIAHRGLEDDVLGGKSQETIWERIPAEHLTNPYAPEVYEKEQEKELAI